MDTNSYIAQRLVKNRMRKLNESSGEMATPEQIKQIEDILNHQLGSYETGMRVIGTRILHETPGTVTFKVEYAVSIQIPIVDPEDHTTYYEDEVEYRTRTMTIDTE